MTTVETLQEKVALACRMLAMEGMVSAISGHVSARIPGAQEMVIRCRGEEEFGLPFTSPTAIRRVNFDGKDGDLDNRYQLPLELPIHGEIYKVRPDVQSVIHAHPPAFVALAVSDVELRPIFGAFNIPAMRMALEGIPLFPHSFHVRRPDIAAQMIAVMGNRDVCVLRAHGITVSGRSVEEAVWRAVNLNTLAKMTLQVAKTGRPIPELCQEDIAEIAGLSPVLPGQEKWFWQCLLRKLEQATTP